MKPSARNGRSTLSNTAFVKRRLCSWVSFPPSSPWPKPRTGRTRTCATSRTRCSAKCRTFSRRKKRPPSSSTCNKEASMLEEKTNPKEWVSTLRISKSHIQTYLICPRKFYFQYVVALPWEFVPASLPFGTSLHEAVAFFYRGFQNGMKPYLELVISVFERKWEEETKGRPIGFALSSKDSIRGLGIALLRQFYEAIQPRNIEAVELPFSVPLYDPDGGKKLEYALVGKIDLIESDDDGTRINDDLKTSTNRYADSQAENQLDGLIYAY